MIKIFIGTEDAQWLPTAVLKYSVLSRTQTPVEFIELKNIPLKLNLKMFTGFSFYRWYIPQASNYEGYSIYLDADIVVLCDILEFTQLDMKGKGVLARPDKKQDCYFASVMLMDCPKLKSWKIDQWVALINAGIADYVGIMTGSKKGLNRKDFGELEEYWNHLDEWNESTKILHYTHVPTQPWKKAGHPYRHVFLNELKKAINAGVINPQDVEREIAAGHVYPKILEDMESGT